MSLDPSETLYKKPVVPHPRKIRNRIPVKQPWSHSEPPPLLPQKRVKVPGISKTREPTVYDPNNPNHRTGQRAYYYNPLISEEVRQRGAAGSYPMVNIDTSQAHKETFFRKIPEPYQAASASFSHNPNPPKEDVKVVKDHKPKPRFNPLGNKKSLKPFTDKSNMKLDEEKKKTYATLHKIASLHLKAGTPAESQAALRNMKAFMAKHNLTKADVTAALQNVKKENSYRLFTHSRFGGAG